MNSISIFPEVNCTKNNEKSITDTQVPLTYISLNFTNGSSLPINPYEKKLFKCTDYGFTFSQKNNLIRHVHNLHLGIIPYRCEICKKSFENKSLLKVHKIFSKSLLP